MSDQWKDRGVELSAADLLLLGTTATHRVENTDTGEERLLDVHVTQTVGEAIANGQWIGSGDDD
jgi:hypothetical protein